MSLAGRFPFFDRKYTHLQSRSSHASQVRSVSSFTGVYLSPPRGIFLQTKTYQERLDPFLFEGSDKRSSRLQDTRIYMDSNVFSRTGYIPDAQKKGLGRFTYMNGLGFLVNLNTLFHTWSMLESSYLAVAEESNSRCPAKKTIKKTVPPKKVHAFSGGHRPQSWHSGLKLRGRWDDSAGT